MTASGIVMKQLVEGAADGNCPRREEQKRQQSTER